MIMLCEIKEYDGSTSQTVVHINPFSAGSVFIRQNLTSDSDV